MRALAFLLLAALPAAAEPRPVPRPEVEVVVMSTRGTLAKGAEVAAPDASPRPMGRLAASAVQARHMAQAMRRALPVIDLSGLPALSGRPSLRPEDLIAAAARTPRAGQGGGICGRASIQGSAIAPVPGNGACGIPEAVRITGVAGLSLSRATRMDCTTAQALDDWVRQGVRPAVGRHGGGAVALQVAAGYACRTRNNQPGAKVSEHGKGRAIDISGIRLADGSELNVLRDWGGGVEGRILRAVWQSACGPFGTVLGPQADRFHRDHFHFDTARYRSGSYCR